MKSDSEKAELGNAIYRAMVDRMEVVVEYRLLGEKIVDTIPAGSERTVALRKLVESKDCAVRAIIEGKEPKHGA